MVYEYIGGGGVRAGAYTLQNNSDENMAVHACRGIGRKDGRGFGRVLEDKNDIFSEGETVNRQMPDDDEENFRARTNPGQNDRTRKTREMKETEWDKRRRRRKRLLREQMARSMAREIENRRLAREYYYECSLVNGRRHHAMLMQSALLRQGMSENDREAAMPMPAPPGTVPVGSVLHMFDAFIRDGKFC